MRQAQTDAHVGVSIEPRAEFVNLVEMIVENHGPGPARNVTLSLDGDFVLQKEPESRLSDTGLFRYGISYLAPQQRIRFYLVSLIDTPSYHG